MPSVRLCSPTNSTMFTTCCGIAIRDDQELCPECRAEITPRSGADRWEAAFGPTRRENARKAKLLRGENGWGLIKEN